MRTTLLHLLRYPDTLHKLYAELSSAELSTPYPKYSEVQHLPYLEACVQEGLRMHPPFALPLERIVPPGGVEVLGHKLPDGTIVGASACVTNFHKPTFGEDAEDWRPERWLESDEAYRHMEQSMLTVSRYLRLSILFETHPRCFDSIFTDVFSSLAMAGAFVLVNTSGFSRSKSSSRFSF